jgi:hypothetical protein
MLLVVTSGIAVAEQGQRTVSVSSGKVAGSQAGFALHWHGMGCDRRACRAR